MLSLLLTLATTFSDLDPAPHGMRSSVPSAAIAQAQQRPRSPGDDLDPTDYELEQAPPEPPPVVRPRVVIQRQEVRPLPGQLDSVPVFNSNSPELVRTEGILLSTFPPNGMRYGNAHLNYPISGRFDIFAHHVSRASAEEEGRTLFNGIMVYNPGPNPVRIETLQAASYLSRPDAPYRKIPSYIEDPNGTIFSGAGSRTVSDVLRGRRRGVWEPVIELAPRQAEMILNLPIPVGRVTPSSNTRSTLIRLRSSGPVYLASMAMFSPKTPDGREQIPTLRQWQQHLVNSPLSGPRDISPTPPGRTATRYFYGRVAGVARGSRWEARLTDPNQSYLGVPQRGQAISYGLSLLPRGTLGTDQVQSAPMLARYPDTAYNAHGNYGIEYALTIPLRNNTGTPQRVAIALQTPLKTDRLEGGGLSFLSPPEERVFFRGPVRITYTDDAGQTQTRHIHVVQHRGEQGEPLVEFLMQPNEQRQAQVDLIYPPDATPPQVLTIKSQP